MTRWTADALSAPHSQRHLDAIPQDGAFQPLRHRRICQHCGQPRLIVKDNETLGIKGVRLVPCECEWK